MLEKNIVNQNMQPVKHNKFNFMKFSCLCSYLVQCFSTAGTRPDTGIWKSLTGTWNIFETLKIAKINHLLVNTFEV